jgi:hypothetical protein
MDNQHKLISGYRDLSKEEIDLMNEIKAMAEQVRELVNRVQRLPEPTYGPEDAPHSTVTHPARWAAIAQTDLQQGFMALVRAVARPSTF